MLNTLRQLADSKVIRPLDYHFARFLSEQTDDPVALLAAALTSSELGHGHTCLNLRHTDLWQMLGQNVHEDAIRQCPPVSSWGEHLGNNPVVGDGSQPSPLVLDGERLYLMRYWQYEQEIAERLNRSTSLPVDQEKTREVLDRLFPEPVAEGEVNWQKVAAAVAATRNISVISGGPGTGKTTTVTRLLALLVELALIDSPDRYPTIHLTAPTGKAAARLTESIGLARSKLNCDKQVRYAITDQASTLHRLLGVIPGRAEFRHNRENRLHLDILVVDEASMIDVSLMARLLGALPDNARLVLLGDRDQLASVEAGSVLGDICSGINDGYSHEQVKTLYALTGYPLFDQDKKQGPAIKDSLCLLRRSYRFDANSGIGKIARAVNEGDRNSVESLCQQSLPDIELHYTGDLQNQLLRKAVGGYRPYLELLNNSQNPVERAGDILDAFDRFQVLCALREGQWGVGGLNDHIRHALVTAGLVENDVTWYHGRPILITRNEPSLELYNGDIGITFQTDENRFRVAFPTPDGNVRFLLPSRLPEHETVFAMTVHKSQGSEFDRIVLALPDSPSPVVTRELVYTGITRARKSLVLFAQPDILGAAVERPIERVTGLAERLQ
ncbi:exodeoxyribonuclease V subunit alpha [Sansalvadorimonas sp. 2012CJ34-2]|uniref:RecBCD enzyme subunit RecD n=1 Tax=Parendozoicomonas callyspongiae TaxID=2942213 RepID=A0ABT0PKH7_9GAMM|nr:exodeoxyribonuclease V subunit alpha [Sansalvadorimonas sp. 2012CJ34-2]MCL6271838.1 exodeoxyribonuclease V subunit alpha [Sansalvadorimonas sp. 2012CJ34-2]